MSKEVVVKPTNEVAESQSLAQSIVAMAANPDVDADKLAKLMELQADFERREAQKAYVKAMAAFKANPPKIIKDTLVEFKTTRYKHAKLAQVAEKVGAALSGNGLTASWKTDQAENGNISVTCCITHELGHSESTTLVSAPDSSGGKNSIQGIGSAVSYLQRYTLLAICGLATYDDTDGVASEPVSEQQLSTLVDLMDAHVVDEAKFLAFWNISDMAELWASNFDKACAMIKSKPTR